jgi:tRNA (guanine-N7-)-methyltransferase
MERNSPRDGFRQRRHFGRRKGPALSAHQSGLIETLLPLLLIKPEPGRDPLSYFHARLSEIWLEVGFGGGEHLLWQAQANPGIGMIGAEPYVSGVAKLLSKVSPILSSPVYGGGAAAGGGGGLSPATSNIRLYTEDATDIIDALPAASLSRVFVLFPDPWPKTRHHKRRFIQMSMLDRLARVMKPGAELRFATDDNLYLVWTLERLAAHPAFSWLAETPNDWRARPRDWPETRYEAKAKRAGSTCTYLRFARR